MTWWRAASDPERIERRGVIRLAPAPARAVLAHSLAEHSAAHRTLTLAPARYYLHDPPVLDWPHALRPFQREGIATLLGQAALLLADDMGLGKTVQAVAALRVLFRRRDIEDALIVVPAAIITQWSHALRAWAPELRISPIRGSAAERAWQWRAPAHVFITSFETLRSDLTHNPHSPPRRRLWGVVTLDEAQKIKNRETDVSRACKRIPRQRAWALTGTPLENRLDELASICPPGTFMFVSLRAGGFGLDLPEASYVFHFDRWWNPAVERQAEDRAHRLGREGPVTAYRYITEHTIEERIDQLIHEKQALFDTVVDRVSLDPQRVLSADELFGLLDLSPPAKR